MPPRKDYGPPTRRSSRLTQEPEAPAVKSEDTEPEKPVHPQNTEPEKPVLPDQETLHPEADEPVPSIEEESAEEFESADENDRDQAASESPEEETIISQHQSPTMTASNGDANQLNALLERIAQLEARAQDNDRGSRGVTPAQSAFGGENFTPTGFAAKPAFKPYGRDQEAKNPSYDQKAKKMGVDPGVFEGDKKKFDKWIVKVADKFMEDNETFKTERSRMAVLNALTEGTANDLLEGRYNSTEMPFRNAAEMVATLSAVYHDDNQGSKAREELRKLEYDQTDKNMDIHQFIGLVNSLADKANISKDDRKIVLYEHIPATINPQLFGDSKDLNISYEAFAVKVADSVLAQQRAFAKRQERKKERRSWDDAPVSRPSKHLESGRNLKEIKKLDNGVGMVKFSDKERQELRKDGKCFVCKKAGHVSKDCPEKKAMIAYLTREDEEEPQHSDSSSSFSDESEN